MAPKHLMTIGLMLCVACANSSSAAPLAPEASTTIAPTGSSPATTALATTTTAPPPRTLSVVAVGDWLSEGLINNAAAAAAPAGVRYNHEPLIRPVVPIIQGADLAICHMETPIGLPGRSAGFLGMSDYGSALISAPYEVAADLHRAGFDRCSTASNHALDGREAAIRDTLDALDAAGIAHSGTARSPEEAISKPFTVNGVNVSHLSYTRSSNTGWASRSWSLNQATAEHIVSDVAVARADGAEIVIISLHTDWELEKAPTRNDRAFVEQITAAAHPDLIIMTGPHVPQPVERVNGTLVYWSLGNFISGMGMPDRGTYADPRTLDGLLAKVRFTQAPDGSWTSEYAPVLLCNVTGSRVVYPGVQTLHDASTPAPLRAQLEACLNRTSAVVADLQ